MSFKGLKDFVEVLNLVNDPDKFKTLIAELNQATEQYTQAIEGVCALADVNDYTTSIRDRETESIKILEEAKQEAASILATSRAQIKEEQSKLSDKQKKLSAAEKVHDQTKLDIASQQQTIQEQLTSIANREKELLAFKAQLDSYKQELDQRAAKLKAALE